MIDRYGVADVSEPTLVADALLAFGPAIVPPLLDRLEAQPELVERKVTDDVAAAVEWSVVSELLEDRRIRPLNHWPPGPCFT